ncbi:MAG: DNA repair protein RecO [Phycisphaerae bacterium]|jgi:DNA repair protein RecO (recombination protein O)
MPVQSDQAVVLRLTEYSETSQIATLFSARHGLLRLIAKGARRSTAKRFAAGLDVLELGEVSFVPARGDAQLGTLTEWVQRDAFLGLRRAAERLYGGLYAAELVAGLTEQDDPHPELFAALCEALAGLAGEGESARVLAVFQSDLLAALGYAPNFEHCVGCRRHRRPGAPAYFSSTAGGLLCRDCEMHYTEKRRLPAGMADGTPRTGDALAWFSLQDYHLTHLAGRPFRSAAQLTAALQPRR